MTKHEMINAFTVAKEGLELSSNKTPMYTEAIELYASLIALLNTGLDFAEANYCVQIIKALLAAGYAVEVHDVLNRSTNLYTIIQALNSTGHDRLALYSRSESGKYRLFGGWVEFIYDNEPKYLVSEHSNRSELESILNRVHENHFGE